MIKKNSKELKTRRGAALIASMVAFGVGNYANASNNTSAVNPRALGRVGFYNGVEYNEARMGYFSDKTNCCKVLSDNRDFLLNGESDGNGGFLYFLLTGSLKIAIYFLQTRLSDERIHSAYVNVKSEYARIKRGERRELTECIPVANELLGNLSELKTVCRQSQKWDDVSELIELAKEVCELALEKLNNL